MRCEVCGRRITGKTYKVIIERARMTVCGGCARLGSINWEPSPIKHGFKVPKTPKTVKKTRQPRTTTSLELAEDFNMRVRRAREKLGLSHEDLGRKIREKVSVIRKIESGKMLPDNKLANKLEHALKTKLLFPFSEPKLPPSSSSLPRNVTLGDIALLKVKKAEVNEEREQS